MHVCNKYQHPNVFFSPVTVQDIRWAILNQWRVISDHLKNHINITEMDSIGYHSINYQ